MANLLFTPLTIRSVSLPNRLMLAPIGLGYSEEDGTPTDRDIEFLRARAQGGTGLVCTGAAYIHPRGRAGPHQLGIHMDRMIPSLARLTNAIHAEGAKAAVQLYHGGRLVRPAVTGGPPLAPSPVPARRDGPVPHELTVAEIHEIVEQYGYAARRAVEAGFDVIQIHGAYHYLPHQFVSRLTNRRTDEYGGSLSNRIRFPVEVVRAVREAVGDRVPLAYRLTPEEGKPEGITVEDTLCLARALEEEGVDLLDITAVNYWVGSIRSEDRDRRPVALRIKEAVGVPVVAVGGARTPELAEQILTDGLDLVAVARGLLADPEFGRKGMEDRSHELYRCIECQPCRYYLGQTCPEEIYRR